MEKDLWLPQGYNLLDGSKVQYLLFSGENWQIFDTTGSDQIMFIRPNLAKKWCFHGFIEDSLLHQYDFGSVSFYYLSVHKKYALYPVNSWRSADNKVDAIAFSFALRESRKLSEDASFHDAIFVEQYSRLLPTWTLTPAVDDEQILGTWLAGGVIVSTSSFRRLKNLVGWLPQDDLIEIIHSAGLETSPNIDSTTKRCCSRETTADDSKTAEAQEKLSKKQHSSLNDNDSKIFRLPGRPQLEEFFNDHVIDIIFNSEKYRLLGLDFPSPIILHGPPGCGKTYAVERLIEFIDWPSYSIDSSTVGSPYIHETSKKISGVFDKAIDNAPSVIVIDEMESFLSAREKAGMSLHHVEEVAEFLRRIPEAIKSRVLVIAMTNLIDMIDPAILRRGRFDHVIEVGMPSKTEIASLLELLLGKLPATKELELNNMVEVLTGKTLADVAYVIRESSRIAAKSGKSQLDQESIDTALKLFSAGKKKVSRNIGFVRE